ECIKLAKEDLKTMTALLDLRFIAGDRSLFEKLGADLDKKLFTKEKTKLFIEEKVMENVERHEKYGGSVFILEPNVKEGEGGLRDLHTARWVLLARNPDISFNNQIKALLTEDEEGELAGALDFLFWVRNDLHLETKRKNDQLTFHQQERIAKLMGFADSKVSLAVESFMQRYYRYASTINRISALMLARALGKGSKRKGKSEERRELDENFTAVNDEIAFKDDAIFENHPELMMDVFLHFRDQRLPLSFETADGVLENLDLVGDDYRRDKRVAKAFINIFKGPQIFRTLTEMNRLNFLGKLIPEFEDISCKVQHDMYHVYTVDVHTLFAIRELERLKSSYKSEFFLYATLYEELPRPELLALGVLFHDIGKSLGKGHAVTGAELTKKILSRFGLKKEDINTVVFLVRYHLILADTAQYRDIHDEKLIVEFSKTVGTIERLNMLFLLTFADVRAVGPDVWTQWKGALFQELYFKALTIIERGTFEVEDTAAKVKRVKKRVKRRLKGDLREKVDEYFSLLPSSYFLSNKSSFIAGDMEMVYTLSDSPFLMSVRQDRDRSYTSLVICTHDTAGLFSMITGVLAANRVNILGAQISTLKSGLVLDVVQVTDPAGSCITDEVKLEKIKSDFLKVVTGTLSIEKLVGKRKPSILDKKERPQMRTFIEVDNEVSDRYTVIDLHTHDRIGLLYKISSVLTSLGVYIAIAKISTKGDDAADIFYVNDIFGQKIFYDKRLADITDALHEAIEDMDKEE
ncbi:MAG: [protein-PII] uridylyltransferase, partial [Thermodesulfobacteriota bacterium]